MIKYITKTTLTILIMTVTLWSQSIEEVRNLKPLLTLNSLNYSARAAAMGGTVTAFQESVSALFNPAGITGSKYPRFYINYETGKSDYSYVTQKNTAEDQYNYSMDAKIQGFSFFTISVPVKIWDRPWTFALSYYRWMPYGATGNVVNTFTPASGAVQSNTLTFNGNKGLDVLAFTTAVQMNDFFSLGITVQQFIGTGTSRMDYKSSAMSYNRIYEEKIKGGRNLIVGAQFTPLESIRIGFSYQNRFKRDFESVYYLDQNNTKTEATVEPVITVPERYSAGVVFKPFDLISLSFDYTRYFWSKSKLSLYHSVSTSLPYPGKGMAGTTQSDQISRNYGIEVKLPFMYDINGYVRGGHSNSTWSQNDKDGKGAKLKIWSAGVGVEMKDVFRVDAAYSVTKGNWDEAGYFDTTAAVKSGLTIKRLTLSFVYYLPLIY